MSNIINTINYYSNDEVSYINMIPRLQLTRSHTAYCPKCNTRTTSNNSNRREVYCIDCLTHTSVVLQRLVKTKNTRERYLKYRNTLWVNRWLLSKKTYMKDISNICSKFL